MAWSPYNVPSNASGTPGQESSARDLYYPYGSVVHQYPPTLAAEPSMFSENYHPYNTLMQHPSAPIRPSLHIPFASAHADLNSPNHNTVHHPSIEINRPREPLTVGYLSSGHSTTCTTPSGSGSSTPSMQESPQSGVGGHEVQSIFGGGRTHRRKDE